MAIRGDESLNGRVHLVERRKIEGDELRTRQCVFFVDLFTQPVDVQVELGQDVRLVLEHRQRVTIPRAKERNRRRGVVVQLSSRSRAATDRRARGS